MLVKFDWSNFSFVAKENYNKEVKNSKNIQDEVKIYNERFPDWLSPLYELDERLLEIEDSVSSIGEFNNSGGFAGDSDQEKIWSFFLGKNFNKKCIAGIMGNIGQETGGSYDPKTIQDGGKGPGTGLIQWGNKADGDRWSLLVNWAKSKNKDEWATETQMEYLWVEMEQQYHINLFRHYLKKYGYSTSGDILTNFSKVDNIEHAMLIFELTIERAGDKHYPRRLKFGQEAYEKFKDWDPSMSTAGSGTFVEPYKVPYSQTSEFGMRKLKNESAPRLHAGIDVAAADGTAIYAVAPGRVVLNEWGNSPGWNVVIDHGTVNGKQVFSRYMHLRKKSNLSIGQTVTINTQIGLQGNTGASQGSHLHLEIQEQSPGTTYSYGGHVNPRNYIEFTGKGRA